MSALDVRAAGRVGGGKMAARVQAQPICQSDVWAHPVHRSGLRNDASAQQPAGITALQTPD